MKNIRNFCIIAHIDHGKSTLADRLLEFTNTIQVTSGQMLDNMDLEKKEGSLSRAMRSRWNILIKGEKYVLNLIDTRDTWTFRMRCHVLSLHVKGHC